MANSASNTEIERKFLICQTEVPDLSNLETSFINQGYLAGGLRLRRRADDYFLTRKEAEGIQRLEYEQKISKELFDQSWPNTLLRRLEKNRSIIRLDSGHLAELDHYLGELKGLITAEVEFNSLAEAHAFVPPQWFGLELTNDRRYSNFNLATNGLVQHNDGYEMELGINLLIAEIDSRQAETPLIVAVAGGSASGKTTIAQKLLKYYGDEALLLSMDHYYRGFKYCTKAGLQLDQPEAVNLELCAEHLAILKKGLSIERPIYSFNVGEVIGSKTIHAKPIIILEGLFAIHPLVNQFTNLKVFVEANIHSRLIRRLIRDRLRTSQTEAEIATLFLSSVDLLHRQYIQINKASADLVINSERRSSEEDLQIETVERQIKFPLEYALKNFSKAGFEIEDKIRQLDHYYAPIKSNDPQELIRVRYGYGKDSGHFSLAYKGKRADDGERACYQAYPLSVSLAETIASSDYQQILTVSKQRLKSSYRGLDFRLDLVHIGVDDNSVFLGDYLEFYNYSPDQQLILEELLAFFNLTSDQVINQSYFELAKEKLAK